MAEGCSFAVRTSTASEQVPPAARSGCVCSACGDTSACGEALTGCAAGAGAAAVGSCRLELLPSRLELDSRLEGSCRLTFPSRLEVDSRLDVEGDLTREGARGTPGGGSLAGSLPTSAGGIRVDPTPKSDATKLRATFPL